MKFGLLIKIVVVIACLAILAGCVLETAGYYLLVAYGIYETINNTTISGVSGAGTGTQTPVTETSESCPCSGSYTGITKVTITADSNLTPNPQYCFLKVEGPLPWQSTPQAFGPGTHVLQFNNVPEYNADFELITCITSDFAVANAGNVDLATQIKKTFVALFDCSTKKCALIEYDYMTGRDIRGGSNLFDFLRSRLTSANVDCSLFVNQQELQDQSITSRQHLSQYTLDVWRQRFLLDPNFVTDFCLMGVQTCINRQNFNPTDSTDTISSSAVGISGPLSSSNALGQRGAWSMVFKRDLDSVLSSSSRQKGYNQVALHELGHAFANLTHPWQVPSEHNGGSSANCAMNKLDFYSSGSIGSGRDKFCNKCNENIENMVW